jgi:hypothetical protein
VTDKVVNPPWRPTPAMRERNPEWPEMIPGGDPGNPLGPLAMYLGWQYYRIHGTHDTRKIGRRSSNGCIGLYNEHIAELFPLCQKGTQVLVIWRGLFNRVRIGRLLAVAAESLKYCRRDRVSVKGQTAVGRVPDSQKVTSEFWHHPSRDEGRRCMTLATL